MESGCGGTFISWDKRLMAHFKYSSGQNKVSVPLLKRRKKCGVHLNKRRSCLSVLLAYFRRTLNVPYRACSQYSLRVSIFKRDMTPPTNKLSSLFTSQLAFDSVFILGAAVVFLCAAELFVRRAAAGVFVRRAVECSSCGEFFRRAAVGLSSSCGEFFRRAAVGLNVELLSGVFFRRAAVGVFFRRAAAGVFVHRAEGVFVLRRGASSSFFQLGFCTASEVNPFDEATFVT